MGDAMLQVTAVAFWTTIASGSVQFLLDYSISMLRSTFHGAEMHFVAPPRASRRTNIIIDHKIAQCLCRSDPPDTRVVY
ncbi:uncharacterized protein EDB91DRAFT_1093823 [Suillus paluster]|uniref:uncharacterized protein n=1 Tax=Suillus paluster TaxID=48578 RepID=UPI001B8793C7|nr:uncharacterized protein EDB91DRAFT_1093823 [Suillus paluster]KAG1756656.1 hypothetical protein EDB91DRAFT_1093823 [Suillus paluster]